MRSSVLAVCLLAGQAYAQSHTPPHVITDAVQWIANGIVWVFEGSTGNGDHEWSLPPFGYEPDESGVCYTTTDNTLIFSVDMLFSKYAANDPNVVIDLESDMGQDINARAEYCERGAMGPDGWEIQQWSGEKYGYWYCHFSVPNVIGYRNTHGMVVRNGLSLIKSACAWNPNTLND